MRRTLRRSCAACAKAKHGCDLQTPKCSRCTERNSSCVYANEPLTSANAPAREVTTVAQTSQELIRLSSSHSTHRMTSNIPSDASGLSALSMTIDAQSIDPFDTYPSTSLSRARVQGLIHHFLSKIVYQYYPWDTNPGSNPFVTSWWHLAISDPALFHVSLQTASLDDELQAQKGFLHSEILMRDSVSLLRRKIQDPSQAFQDATMNAVVTLAAIEHGKGNLQVSKMHIEGVKSMVYARGGISKVKDSNPLTARMVSWVSMLVMGSPQFQAQDDLGLINGISPIQQWGSMPLQTYDDASPSTLSDFDLDPVVEQVFTRLRIVFSQCSTSDPSDTSTNLSIDDRQDLASFVVHKLLLLTRPIEIDTRSGAASESIRYAISIYMFIVHGPTYYSHMEILKELVLQFKYHLTSLTSCIGFHDPLSVWLFSVGMVASIGTEENEWFVTQTSAVSVAFDFHNWEDVIGRLKSFLWLEGTCGIMFRQAWKQILESNDRLAGRWPDHAA